MLRKQLASFGFFLFGIFSVPLVNAASYTHRLDYNHVDNGTNAVLFGIITFEDTDNSAQINFGGAISFNISSAVNDGAGRGKFEYDVPSGFFSLCTKNLANHG